MKILIINGPNLNLLGTREPQIYGCQSLDDINAMISEDAEKLGAKVDFYQSNHEGAIIDKIHEAIGVYNGIIINAGAYTHYSFAIRDAISSVGLPVIEVHMSDIQKREEFRKVSVIKDVCILQISGLGAKSYTIALKRLIERLI